MNTEIPTPRTEAAISKAALMGCPETYLASKMAELERETTELRSQVEELGKRLLVPQNWTVEDPRMLREQIRVADEAFNHLNETCNTLRSQLLASELAKERMRVALEAWRIKTSNGYDEVIELSAIAKEALSQSHLVRCWRKWFDF